MRYTEVRMKKIAHHLLNDIDQDTVDFQENYDNSESEPIVLPAEFPNLLVNGAGGIAVGMATNIPPHNLSEVTEACIMLINNPETDINDLCEIVPGPDFPTGGLILGKSGAKSAYTTGRGSVFGSKPSPTLKICSNSKTFSKMKNDMDINCGTILENNSIESLGDTIYDHIIKISSGEHSKSELLDFGDEEFIPWIPSPVM